MDKLRIMGGQSLAGTVDISGAKNAALPELCAALLSNEPVTLTNVPRLQDVSTMLKLIRNMGVRAEQGAAGQSDSGTVRIDAGRLDKPEAPYELVKTMRDTEVSNEGFLRECTPGYYNNEGGKVIRSHLGEMYGPGFYAFEDLIKAWCAEGNLQGLKLGY